MTTSEDQAIYRFGLQVLERHLAAMRQEIAGIRLGKDIEAIHHMRVASRRLRAALPLFASYFPKQQQKVWEKEIPSLTRALGEARDTDVQIESLQIQLTQNPGPRLAPGIQRVVLRLTQRRAGLQANVVHALDGLENSGALNLAGLDPLDPQTPENPPEPFDRALYRLAGDAIQQKLAFFLAFEPFVSHPEASEQLHAMRIAAKRLRYMLEIFAPLYDQGLKTFLQAGKTAQELLGNIHDCDVWVAFLPLFASAEKQRILDFYGHTRPFLPLTPGIRFLEENRRLERQHQYEEFVLTWENWRSLELWKNLADTVSLPMRMVPSATLYPAQIWVQPPSKPAEESK
jgi:CHAD domain-containing protein